MAKYMFLIRGGDYEAMSPDQMGSVVDKFIAWSRSVRADGFEFTGDELDDRAVVLKGDGQRPVVADGLFTEAKDIVGGYFLLDAPDLETATGIAKGCPNLEYGGLVEVRPIIER